MIIGPDLRVETLDWASASETAIAIRLAVFVAEQRVPLAEEIDSHDPLSEHALAYAGGKAVGTGRLLPDGHIGRMAVLAHWRGRGVGAAILARLLDRARARGFEHALLNAQTHAIGFYAKQGFEVDGPPFIEAGIAHVQMRLELLR